MQLNFFTLLILILLIKIKCFEVTAEFLRVDGKEFYFGEDKVFLSGVNIAWNNYAFDFGNQKYEISRPFLEKWIKEIASAGGNSLRIWIHIEGQNTPKFDQDGNPTSPDNDGTLISDLSKFLDFAENNNIFVIPVLWNGAVGIKDNFRSLIMDDEKLEAYFENVLVPMVQALKSKPALGAWEIMNEPEGSVMAEIDVENPCFDTMKFKNLGLDWTNSSIPMERMLRFINKHSAVIKKTDPKALVTLGSWSHFSQTDAFEGITFNHYKDECLITAGGEPNGTIDFYQMHTYAWEGQWAPTAPFKVTGDSYKLDKPVVIGEFSSACSMNEGVDALWDYGYNNGYAGLWSWMYNSNGKCSDTAKDQVKGMQRIRKYSTNGKTAVKIRRLDSENDASRLDLWLGLKICNSFYFIVNAMR